MIPKPTSENILYGLAILSGALALTWFTFSNVLNTSSITRLVLVGGSSLILAGLGFWKDQKIQKLSLLTSGYSALLFTTGLLITNFSPATGLFSLIVVSVLAGLGGRYFDALENLESRKIGLVLSVLTLSLVSLFGADVSAGKPAVDVNFHNTVNLSEGRTDTTIGNVTVTNDFIFPKKVEEPSLDATFCEKTDLHPHIQIEEFSYDEKVKGTQVYDISLDVNIEENENLSIDGPATIKVGEDCPRSGPTLLISDESNDRYLSVED